MHCRAMLGIVGMMMLPPCCVYECVVTPDVSVCEARHAPATTGSASRAGIPPPCD
jgi:hypothetical protein